MSESDEEELLMLERSIFNYGLNRAKSSRIVYPMSNFSRINKIKEKIFYFETKKRRLYNFPMAFLFEGLIDYAINNENSELLDKIAKCFEKYISIEGKPSFDLNKVDQVPFAISALNLAKVYGSSKYIKFADYTFEKLLQWVDPDYRLIKYRENRNVLLVDLLAMICPFLMYYGKVCNNDDAIRIAERHIDYFVRYGIENDSHLPFHGINIEFNVKVGPINWGRGIGWYMLALNSALENESTNSYKYKTELIDLITFLKKLRSSQGLWSQFPGSSSLIDNSASLLYMYVMNKVDPGYYKKKSILQILKNYIAKNGAVTNSSGETYGLNSYSNAFGESEFSQGILLKLLSSFRN